jgi:hypothetical protein
VTIVIEKPRIRIFFGMSKMIFQKSRSNPDFFGKGAEMHKKMNIH